MRLPSRPCGNNPSQTPLRIAQNKLKTKDFAICINFQFGIKIKWTKTTRTEVGAGGQ